MLTGKSPTDEMFKEGLNLHNFVKTALPERLVEITDPILLQERDTGETTSNRTCDASSQRDKIRVQCSNSIFEIGVSCSAEFPTKRMNMSGAASKLCFIRKKFPTQLRRRRPTRNTVQSPGIVKSYIKVIRIYHLVPNSSKVFTSFPKFSDLKL